ncbi:serpin family protein [Imperialibacter roseus]|uniref:Serpin family protein n=1 Tax=Imperialibacter roseus TaxID=1324217 RepID=A0ABZ0IH75_9BACT|nr:serpin family protein [Imperialibacter roseus]WOK04399.1 serpin family protein [Imperialibacter roseus]
MKHLLANINRLTWVSLFVTTFISGCSTEEPVSNIPNLRTLSVPEEQVASASNNFSFDVFYQINKQHQSANIFISPFSISAALSMTANGAEGDTKSAIKQVIGNADVADDDMNEAYKGLQDFLLDVDKKVALEIANSNWYTKEYTIKSAFKEILLNYYNAEVKSADFRAPTTVGDINGWIEDKTNGKIRDMLDRIPDDAVMYLINAIYFKADWQYKFDDSKTTKATFYAPTGETEVDMMFSKGARINYRYGEDFTMVDIPYGNGQYSMTIFMQAGSRSINQIIETFDGATFADYLDKADTITAELYLPRFKLQFKEELKETLSDMGMGIAFSDKADFSNLFDEKLALVISRVLHQSFIEVNEKGSEAAAATIVEMVELSSNSTPHPRIFRVDRPFAFFIREKHSNVILFAGKMLSPTNN